MSYFHKGELEKASEAFQQALRNGFSQEQTYNNLGLTLAKMGRYQYALEAFLNAGDKAKAYNNIGVIYLSEGKYAEAIDAFEQALKLSPTHYAKASENLKLAREGLRTRPVTPNEGRLR